MLGKKKLMYQTWQKICEETHFFFPLPIPFRTFILSAVLFSMHEEFVTGGEDARVGAGVVFGEELFEALFCWIFSAFFSARGQPDTL